MLNNTINCSLPNVDFFKGRFCTAPFLNLRFLYIGLIFCLSLFLFVEPAAQADQTDCPDCESQLYSGATPDNFAFVPPAARPWCYYWILKGNITREQITKDLEAMSEQGFGGLLVFDSRRYHDDFDSKDHVSVPLQIEHEFMSDSWQELALHLLREADRLGLQVSLNIADSGGVLRGPWDMGKDGPKELIWTCCDLRKPGTVELPLTIPDDKQYYTDVALIAVELPPTAPQGQADQTAPANQTAQENPISASWSSDWQTVVNVSDQAPTVKRTIDLKPFVQDGKLVWTAPAGNWRIVRFGYQVVGDTGAVDILDSDAVSRYFHLFADDFLKKAGRLVGTTLTHFYNVSWEGSNPDWSVKSEKAFADLNGYPMSDFWPVLCGLNVESVEKSKRFETDFYRTISWMFQNYTYANIGRLCHERGIVWHSEDGGPWRRTAPIFRESDMLQFWGQNDIAQGEFWVKEKSNVTTRSNMRYTSMAAHIHGQRLVAAESFTHMTRHWTMYPSLLKPAADVNFVDGMNMLIWHTFTASQDAWGKPGLEYFAGTHVNRNVTWFPYVGGFLKYLGRCQYLLRQGDFVSDVCVYVSDKNYVGWGRAEKWNEKSELALPAGYKYDLLDTQTLVEKLKYEPAAARKPGQGAFTLPGGARYRLLVVDLIESDVPVEALEKLEALIQNGAPIVFGRLKPTSIRGLRNAPEANEKLSQIANRLWNQTGTAGTASTESSVESTNVIASSGIGLIPDFEGPFEFCHRKAYDQDIYFVSGGKATESGPATADCLFRISDRTPQLWDPLTGFVRNVEFVRTDDGRTKIAIPLEQGGSVFVVFDKNVWKIDDSDRNDSDRNDSDRNDSDRNDSPAAASMPALTLSGPWQVRFAPERGAPAEKTFDALTDWTDDANPGIKYYSGTAVYQKSFDLTSQQAKRFAWLNLGTVGQIARVRLNGADLGVVWTAPWTVNVASVLKSGKNELEIDVANVWANRLIGDALAPVEQRVTKSNMHLYENPGDIPDGGTRKFMPWQGFNKQDKLIPSGLLGPVEIR